jgi:amidase
MDPWPTLDHTGVFARSVADAALLMSVMARGAISKDMKPLDRPPRLAVVRTPVWDQAEAPQREALAQNAATLRSAGADVRDLDLPPEYADAHRVQRMIMAVEAARHFASMDKEEQSSGTWPIT